MPLSPQQRHRALLPSFLRPLPSFLRRQEPDLANADQNLTEVDTRLTKVDNADQNLTPSTPALTPNPSKVRRNRNRARHPVNPVVNLHCQHLRRTPNNPEQIRTNLNKPEHRRTPRPDRDAARITQNPPDQKNPNKPAPPSVIPACAGRNDERGGMRAPTSAPRKFISPP